MKPRTNCGSAIFATTRIDTADPVSAWRAHDAELQKRAAFMNAKRYFALQYRGPGTDFRLGLADDHEWLGGGTTAGNGVYCIPNMPTEEIFSAPHKDRADGTVTATKPLSHQGTMIEGIQVRFEKGRIVEARATRGQEVLEKLIDTDEGARRLGEVALVPHSSPIAQSGLVFLNTLFDENAASHIALGQSYSSCLRDGDKLYARRTRRQGRQRQPDPRGLDDRLRRIRHRRHHRVRRRRAAHARRRVGDHRLNN